MNAPPWSDTDIATLKKLWPTHSASQIGAKLGRTRNAVIGKANRLDLPEKVGRGAWSATDEKRLTDLWGSTTAARIGAQVNRSEHGVKHKARRLDLPKLTPRTAARAA